MALSRQHHKAMSPEHAYELLELDLEHSRTFCGLL